MPTYQFMEHFDENKVIEELLEPKTRHRAFETIVRRESENLYWVIRRIVLSHDDADDVLQNTFLKAWNSIEQFQNRSKISTWLYRIAVNEALDFVRRNKYVADVDADDPKGVAAQLMADNWLDGDMFDARLQEAIATLPDVQRTVFILKYYENMKYSEMSRVLDTSEGALKSSYHIAVKKISEYVSRNE